MKKYRFPENFLWGASTAAHQVEGNNINSDWWSWELSDKKRPKSGTACNHYNLFDKDFELARSLGHNCHRLSIEWARIEPEEGVFDAKEIKHYKKVFHHLKKNNLKSFVTLWHFTLPKWFLEKGGFESKSNIIYFERYAKTCAKEFGSSVDYWITVNEPGNYTLKSYLIGWWPPQKKNFFKALKVYINVASAHRVAQKTIHNELENSKVSFAHQLISFYPEKNSLADKAASITMNFFANDLFLFFAGREHDFFGLNYYFHNKVSFKKIFSDIPDDDLIKTLSDNAKKYGWGMSAKGLGRVLKKAWRHKKPIFVLENGIDDGTDHVRGKRITQHIKEIAKAIKQGIDVRSYLHWSLMDNFEWQFGFEPRFGLCRTDYKTQKRTPRKSAHTFSKIARENAI